MNAFIDQHSRKVLPAWILDGLEKAEHERQKKLLKEAQMKAAEEAAKARRAAKGLGKFVSMEHFLFHRLVVLLDFVLLFHEVFRKNGMPDSFTAVYKA